ncbi:methyl-accepting chemotaxis protein [Vibrio taketomensis]|uniref:methyl-accepting chemotaxis protein n=1 Tax=Vibrio taketomensis TaxID=2572923 RepID=UPI00138A2573|nr:methyl-accepting chemotaxis protein [Vibrio taketomensis]
MLHSLSVKYKISLPILSIIAVFLVTSMVNVFSSRQQTRLTEELNNVIIPVLFNIEDAYRDFYQATSAVQGIALSEGQQDSIDYNLFEYKDNAYKTIPRMKKVYTVVETGVMPEELTPAINQMVTSTEKWLNSYEALLAAPQSDWIDLYQQQKGSYDQQFATVRDELNVVKDALEAKKGTLQEAISAASTFAERSLFIGILLVIILAIGAYGSLIRSIVKPIESIQKAMAEIASGDGDLNQTIQSNSSDELGRLATSFNLFVGKIRNTILQVIATNQAVKTELAGLVDASQGISEQTNQQRIESEHVSAAIQEMQATSQNVSENAHDAAQASQSADEEVKSSAIVLEQTVASIRTLASEVDQAGQVVNHLSEDVSNIASVLDVIKGIAEQTNLLALNAAIEAARAGEQGRGFAVVADEVRSLASRTQQSTGEIQSMIEKLQTGAEQAVEVMNRSKVSSETTIETAGHANKSLQVILEAIARISAINTEIASAAGQQNISSEQISNNIHHIANNSNQVVSSAEFAEKRVNVLNQQCDELDRLVSQFKC